jgi:integrating conjugative element protein (TIGR03755 family)
MNNKNIKNSRRNKKQKKSLLRPLLKPALFALGIAPLVVQASIIPSGNSPFYYQLGGGQAIPIPAFIDQQTIPLRVEGGIGLGYNCGVFDPLASIVNAFNGDHLKNSFMNVQKQVVDSATGAVLEWPLYEISRDNTSLYNLLTNNIFGAKDDFSLSTKSCQVMQNEIAQGKNPYHNWSKIAVGNDWKYYMSMGDGSRLSAGDANGIDPTDINEVKEQVAKDNGANGVAWVQGVNSGRGGLYAGGKGQPSIQVIKDTSIAGYNVIIGRNRAYNDTSAPTRTKKNAHLVDAWRTPTDAANWITRVLGDEEVTTYSGGDKDSTPGIGLLPEIQNESSQIAPKLANLVGGTDSMTLDNLKAVSAPSVMINQNVINKIRQLSPVNQSIYVGKLAQIVATAKIADKAQLALRILESGSQVPPIFANKAAQDDINPAIRRLSDGLQRFLFNVKMNQVVADPIAALMASTTAQQLGDSSIRTGAKPQPVMNNGAIKQTDE